MKIIWTVDREQVLKFANEYNPRCDMLLVHINWSGMGGVYYFTREMQGKIMQQMGRHHYIALPKPGTNPRGVELSKQAVRTLAKHPQSLRIPVKWEKREIQFDPYKRWLELWEQD